VGATFAYEVLSPVTVSNSYAAVSVSGTGTNVGGLVGWDNNCSLITACYATGSVSGDYNIGGLVGMQSWLGRITYCYATGSATGNSSVGGLVGWDSGGEIRHCYAVGLVSPTGANVGGLAGWSDCGGIDNCFWNIQTSQTSDGVGNADPDPVEVIGRTTAEMMTLSTFTSAGWDFTNETTNGSDDNWRMCVDGINYPQPNWKSIDSDLVCPDGVNTEDLDAFIPRWLMETCTLANNYCGGGDINKTGTVNLADFAIFAEHWLEGI
jgi:hypothetical protein